MAASLQLEQGPCSHGTEWTHGTARVDAARSEKRQVRGPGGQSPVPGTRVETGTGVADEARVGPEGPVREAEGSARPGPLLLPTEGPWPRSGGGGEKGSRGLQFRGQGWAQGHH